MQTHLIVTNYSNLCHKTFHELYCYTPGKAIIVCFDALSEGICNLPIGPNQDISLISFGNWKFQDF